MANFYSRRSILQYYRVGLLLPFTGCSTFGAREQSNSIPIFVNNHDDDTHKIRIHIDEIQEPFTTQVSVEAGSLVKVTELVATEFCLGADVLELDDGERSECPAPDESDYSSDGYVVVIYSEPIDEHNSRWLIQPVQKVEPSE